MRQPKAKSKLEKCKYKRCMYKRTHPEDKPRYCWKHWLFLNTAVAQLEYKSPPLIKDSMPSQQVYMITENHLKHSTVNHIKLEVDNTTHIASIAGINGKCAWCGKVMDNLSIWHYRRHSWMDKLRTFILVDK